MEFIYKKEHEGENNEEVLQEIAREALNEVAKHLTDSGNISFSRTKIETTRIGETGKYATEVTYVLTMGIK